ncbi:MAG: flagellar hook-associated protein FlgK [Myxococcota bacterium]
MGILDTLRTGASGLFAASAGLDATSHNIARARLPGATRRSLDVSTQRALRQGLVHVGQGVQVDGIVRDDPGLLGVQRIDAAGEAASARTRRDGLSFIAPLVDETVSSGPRSTLTAFFESLTVATTDPGDPNLRTAVLQAGEAFATSVVRASSGFDDAMDQFTGRIEAGVAPVNEMLAAVASFNAEITGVHDGVASPDLADERDRVVRELAELAGFEVRFEANDTATLYLDDHIVVQGSTYRTVTYEEPATFSLAIDGGTIAVDPGGALQGYVEAYDAVRGYKADLDAFAEQFADEVAATQALGFTAGGATGGPLFTFDAQDPAGSFSLAAGLTADDLAFAGNAGAAAGDGDNLARLVLLQNQQFVGGRTPGDALSSITNQVALDLAEAERVTDRTDAVLLDLDQLAENLHGIDVDEEATQLVAYQTAYQASARVVSTAQSLVSTLLEIT